MIDAQNGQGKYEVRSGQEVSTLVIEVSTHVNSEQYGIDVLTHRVEESTHNRKRCRHMGMKRRHMWTMSNPERKVLTHGFEVSTHANRGQIG